ncbi:MAG TPA: metallophosphoesterase [Polyangiaceae bacterium]|nr:metallophosphoesterase [Polyangiaceae bacterium]
MRIQLLSDLHFEFQRDGGRAFVDALDPRGVDVLVLAGDIAVATGIPAALALLCSRYRHASVVYVHGNHEFYSSDRETVHELTGQAQRENANLVWLDVGVAEILGQRFIGAPLWFPRHPDERRLKVGLSDFAQIRGLDSWVYLENTRSVAFLEQHLGPRDIVVSHHLPSQRSVAPRYVGHPLNPFFVCDLEPLILERQPRLWLHGHTHSSVRTELGETRLLCNPFGYAGIELNPEFLAGLVVDV